jgi:hypothetical protein
VVTMPYYPGRPTAGRNFRPLPPGFLGSAPGLSQQQQQQQQQQRPRPLQLPFMAVYRSGSVVFGGLDEKEELWWLSQLVPPLVRYTGKDGSPWTKGVTEFCSLRYHTPYYCCAHRCVCKPTRTPYLAGLTAGMLAGNCPQHQPQLHGSFCESIKKACGLCSVPL